MEFIAEVDRSRGNEGCRAPQYDDAAWPDSNGRARLVVDEGKNVCVGLQPNFP
jgi:hypothetical protein